MPPASSQVAQSSDFEFPEFTGISPTAMTFLGDIQQQPLAPESSMRFTSPGVVHAACSVSHQISHCGPARERPPRRARPSAARSRGADADRPCRRAVLEGVRQPDRAREDQAHARDDRVARREARRRRRLPRDAGSPPTSAAASRRCSRAQRRSRTTTSYAEAVEELESSRTAVLSTGAVELEARALSGGGLGADGAAASVGRPCRSWSAAARSPKAPASRTSTARRCCSGWAFAATTFRVSPRRSRSSARR